jgi:hypothetical protein
MEKANMRSIFLMLLAPAVCHGQFMQVQMQTGMTSTINPTSLSLEIMDENTDFTLGSVRNQRLHVVNTTATITSDADAVGLFTMGNSGTGQLLPAANRDATNPNATYSGGIGSESGIVLSTGYVDDDASVGAEARANARGIGASGPNNGWRLVDVGNPGEVSAVHLKPSDQDVINEFFRKNGVVPGGGDANVLFFEFNLSKPAYVRISFVHASDEHERLVTRRV